MRRRGYFLGISLPSIVMLLVLALACCAMGSTASRGDAGVSKDSDGLICHTQIPAECYPKIFQPTEEFQLVHPDQDLPPGLHVRVDMATGQKEAKLNDPNEALPELDGLPVDRGVVVVDLADGDDSPSSGQRVVPQGAPVYEPVGAVKQPSDESSSFHENLKALRNGPSRGWFGAGSTDTAAFDDALAGLGDLSHDIYYGLKIAEDTEAVKSLLCRMSTGKVFDSSEDEAHVSRATQSAKILAAALQNNPKALLEVEREWDDIKKSTCPTSSSGPLPRISEALFTCLQPDARRDGVVLENWQDQPRSLEKAKLAALNGLIKSEVIRRDFLDRRGGTTRQVLELLLAETPSDPAEAKEAEAVKRKAANFMSDNFLDTDMGAALGQWPTGRSLGAETCEKQGGTVEWEADGEGCWDYHLERLASEHKGDVGHWSQELWRLFRAERERQGQGKTRSGWNGKEEL